MTKYKSIDEALNEAACLDVNRELGHRVAIEKGIGFGTKYNYSCHDVRDCPFKEADRTTSYCAFDLETEHLMKLEDSLPGTKESRELFRQDIQSEIYWTVAENVISFGGVGLLIAGGNLMVPGLVLAGTGIFGALVHLEDKIDMARRMQEYRKDPAAYVKKYHSDNKE